MKKLLTTLIALIIWMPLTASLDLDNCYISAFGGPNFIPDSKQEQFSKAVRKRAHLYLVRGKGTKHFKTGVFGGIALGKKIDSFRIEHELSYRTNSLDNFKTKGYRKPGLTRTEDDLFIHDAARQKVPKKIIHYKANFRERLHTWALMLNGYYDFDCSAWCSYPLKPYVGIGLGIAFNHIHNLSWGQRDGNLEARIYQVTWAWQIIAGLSYPIAEPIDIGLEYRYFDSRIKKIHNHNLALLARYNF